MKKEFLWGGALSNVQAEGGYLEDGKGLNVYDTLVVTPEPGIKPMFCTTDVATELFSLSWLDAILIGKKILIIWQKWGLKHIDFLLFGQESIHWEMKKNQMKKD